MAVCLCQALPNPALYYGADYPAPDHTPDEAIAGKQGGILENIGTALAPIVGAVIGPLLTNIATGITNGITAGLAAGLNPLQTANSLSGHSYDAYMINVPDSPNPYLFLTAAQNKNGPPTLPPNVFPAQRPSSSASTSASSKRPSTSLPHHIGTVNIKSGPPSSRPLTDASEESPVKGKLSDLRVLGAPSYA